MRNIIVGLAATAVVVGIGTASPAFAHDGHDHHGGTGTSQTSGNSFRTPAHGPAAYFLATLTGSQEVPTSDGPTVGDPDGLAQALVEVKGDRVIFAMKWQGIGAPTLGHIHQGQKGVNGDVKVPLFTSAMPDTVDAAAGQVSVSDAALAKQLTTNPADFYVNLHSEQFAGGAVRGQLKPVKFHGNPLGIIDSGSEHALMDGEQEVPVEGKKVGDPDGRAITFVHPHDKDVDFSMAWVNTGPPTLGHLHQGDFGQNGDVKVPLFTTAIPAGIFAISGSVKNQDSTVVQQLQSDPSSFYSNLHTSEFPDGALRGQLFAQKTGTGTGEQNTGGDNEGSDNNTQATPGEGSAVLFDDPGSFSEENASQGITGKGCVDVFRPGVASAIQTSQPVKVWSGKGCTGESRVINGDTVDLAKVNFDNKISSVFFGSA